MRCKMYVLILIASIILLGSSCSVHSESTSLNNTENSKEQNDIPLPVTYMIYHEQYRFIGKSSSLLWMPCENSPKVNDLSNVLVEVLFAGYTTQDNVWLFVSYMTYDTPTNNRGWINEFNTEKYTKENQKLVKDIIIPKGTLGVDNNENTVENYDQFGFIEEQEEDKVLVMFAGGKEVWYYKKDIKYPPLD